MAQAIKLNIYQVHYRYAKDQNSTEQLAAVVAVDASDDSNRTLAATIKNNLPKGSSNITVLDRTKLMSAVEYS